MDPKLLSTRQVAERLGVSVQYISKLVAQNKLTPATPRIKRQSMWFAEEEVTRFEQQRTHRRRRLSAGR